MTGETPYIVTANPALAKLYEWCGWPPREAVFVKCPYCQQLIAENWLPTFVTVEPDGSFLSQPQSNSAYNVNDESAVTAICGEAGVRIPRQKSLGPGVGLTGKVEWMRCPNRDCQQLLIKATRRLYDPYAGIHASNDLVVETSVVFPKHPNPRPLDPLVPDPYARDFREACLILDLSPRMSAVLSRKIVSDLLERFAGYTNYTLAKQIDSFIDDPKYPSEIKENMHYLREIGDFAAHTKTNTQTAEIIDVGPVEAEWTLTVIEGLLDYFVIAPARAAARRAEMDAKLNAAGRKPIPPRNPGTP